MPTSIYFFKEVQFRLQQRAAIISWIKRVIKQEGRKTGILNYIFCSDKYLLEINRQFLKHDYYTDIITFNYNQGKEINGDIYISIPRVKENADQLGVAFHVELKRVMIHGVLHLLGYSDKTKAQKKEMRRREDECLATLQRFT